MAGYPDHEALWTQVLSFLALLPELPPVHGVHAVHPAYTYLLMVTASALIVVATTWVSDAFSMAIVTKHAQHGHSKILYVYTLNSLREGGVLELLATK